MITSVCSVEGTWKVRDKKTGTVHHYEWDIGLPLNDANFHLKVNMLKYKETNKKGEITVLMGPDSA